MNLLKTCLLVPIMVILTSCSQNPDKQAKKDCQLIQDRYVEGYANFPNNFDYYERDKFIFSTSYPQVKDPRISYLVKQLSDLVETDYPNWDWIAKMQEPPARVLTNSIFNQCRIFDIDLGAKVLR
jgi:hypothetical protein